MATATDVIVISGVVMTTSTIVRRVRKKQKDYLLTVVYGFLVTVALLLIAVPVPTIAKALAYLGMVGAFAVNGPEIFKLVSGITK